MYKHKIKNQAMYKLMENCFADKSIAEMGGSLPPPLTENSKKKGLKSAFRGQKYLFFCRIWGVPPSLTENKIILPKEA